MKRGRELKDRADFSEVVVDGRIPHSTGKIKLTLHHTQSRERKITIPNVRNKGVQLYLTIRMSLCECQSDDVKVT